MTEEAKKEVYVVIETFDGGDCGYWIRSDGYCEQWGRVWSLAGASWQNTLVKLFKKYRDALYNITTSHQHRNYQTNTYEHATVWGLQPQQFYLNYYSYANEGFTMWRTCGYLEEGQY